MSAGLGLSIARRFHDETTHTPYSVRTSGHTLEWDIKPFPFKVYTELPGLALPREIDVLARPTLEVLASAASAASPRRRVGRRPRAR